MMVLQLHYIQSHTGNTVFQVAATPETVWMMDIILQVGFDVNVLHKVCVLL